MRAKRLSAEEQYRLIMECRSSGMTDYQWCMEHQIKPGTFYTWVKRLRANGNPIPDTANAVPAPVKQEVVKLELARPSAPKSHEPAVVVPTYVANPQVTHTASTMEVAVAGAVLRIPNGTDMELLGQVIRILKDPSC